MLRLLILALATLPLQAQAQFYWEYDDWQVWVEETDTGEDLRRSCTAWTGGDGEPVLRLEISNGDAGPPYVYPYPSLSETAPRHYKTQMQDGQHVQFVTDTGAVFSTTAEARFNEEGLFEAHAVLNLADNLPTLQAMKQGSHMEIRTGGNMVFRASLAGFTAAYGKMMDSCGFSLSLD
ncbi:hypothetical protein PXK01_04700 [Phaeobacter sp. PT47_59]|uniref:hypothetical protein n=1 Tax=Phaeobacter sp. PT47_59 TaxID=3029979 RepID=UPI0023807516|nr:hypothetical protein [Phaeobacter sp. PT47_59]MDE4173442.1 hypothetical protein [Phaeobacter sp. PT47_59]